MSVIKPPSEPFINTRIYTPNNEYSIDFYEDIESKLYGSKATFNIKKLIDQMWETNNSSKLLTHFYFTLCPYCQVAILTSRPLNKNIQCKNCSKKHETKDLRSNELNPIAMFVTVEINTYWQSKVDKKSDTKRVRKSLSISEYLDFLLGMLMGFLFLSIGIFWCLKGGWVGLVPIFMGSVFLILGIQRLRRD